MCSKLHFATLKKIVVQLLLLFVFWLNIELEPQLICKQILAGHHYDDTDMEIVVWQ